MLSFTYADYLLMLSRRFLFSPFISHACQLMLLLITLSLLRFRDARLMFLAITPCRRLHAIAY